MPTDTPAMNLRGVSLNSLAILPHEGCLPPDIHHSHDTTRSSLHCHANENEDGGNNKRPTTTDFVRQPHSCQGPEESASLQHGDDIRGQVGFLGRALAKEVILSVSFVSPGVMFQQARG